MNNCLPQFNSARVVVFGDVMLDRYWSGPVNRISPEAPVPVVHVTEHEERPGGAGNVALNIVALEAQTTVVGLVGDDEAGRALDKYLSDAGVNCAFQVVEGQPTITKLRILSRHQQLIRVDFEEGFHDVFLSDLTARCQDQLPVCGAIVLSDYGKGSLSDCQQVIQQARSRQIPVIVDPKGHDFEKYRQATLITPNMTEFEQVVGACQDDAEIVRKGQTLRAQLDLTALLITRSEKGVTLIEENRVTHLPTQAQEVFDVTGAGDTVVATLATALAAGVSLPEATKLANVAAGIVVGKLGTATASVSELCRELHLEKHGSSGVLNEHDLVLLLNDRRERGERIVMTNGCFDLLHAGHVSYLQAAKAYGDRLIVAVNSDESVKQLKGAERPVNRLEQRMAVLAGLESVDWVVSFEEDTPERLICRLQPDVLIKGGDYRVEDIAGGACVTKQGGEVVVVHYQDGQSTTKIINRIMESSS
jgi:D-beta-D-heptose 7-phosphate kinase / D-beta-D-heptose 1-phosphate adenosyltransferase